MGENDGPSVFSAGLSSVSMTCVHAGLSKDQDQLDRCRHLHTLASELCLNQNFSGDLIFDLGLS